MTHINHGKPCKHFHPREHICALRKRLCDHKWEPEECTDFAPGKLIASTHDFTVDVPCIMTPGELDKLLELMQDAGSRVLEFGTFVGGSAKWLSKVATKVVTVDDFSGNYAGSALDWIGGRDLLQEAQINLREELQSGHVEIIRANSKYERDALIRHLGGRVFDLIFVDANHDKDHVKNDIEVGLAHLRPGGVVCGHDYHLQSVREAVTEVLGEVHRLSDHDNFRSLWWKVVPEGRVITVTKVTLHMDGCPGDWMMLTAACYSIAEDHPGRFLFRFGAFEELHRGAPWSCLCSPDKEIKVCYGSAINRSSQHDVRFLPAFHDDLATKLGLTGHIKTNKPHLYLSPWEIQLPKQVDGDYAVINAGYKTAQEVKHWGHANWQEVTDYLVSRGLKVVQVGQSKDNHRPLRGAVDLIDKTDLRQLIRLAYHSKLGLGPESMLHHIYASHFHTPDGRDREAVPFVCVASGWNPKGWASYNTEVYVTRQGQLDCCRGSQGCWKSTMDTCIKPTSLGAERVGLCMSLIQPMDVIRAIETYYAGGIL